MQSQDFDSSILSCLDSAFSAFNGHNGEMGKSEKEVESTSKMDHQKEEKEGEFELKFNQKALENKLNQDIENQKALENKLNQNIENQKILEIQETFVQKESNIHATFRQKESNITTTFSQKESNIYSIDSQEIFSDCNPLIQDLTIEFQSGNAFLAIESASPLIPCDLFEDDNWEMDLNESTRPPKESPILVKRPLIARNLIISSPLSSKPSPIAVSAPKRPAPIGAFLDIEAEESQPLEGSEAEEHTSDYEEMSSFIADEESSQGVDMNFYRKSLVMSQIPEFEGRKNLFDREGRFKLRL
jgi:hypothetical protein